MQFNKWEVNARQFQRSWSVEQHPVLLCSHITELVDQVRDFHVLSVLELVDGARDFLVQFVGVVVVVVREDLLQHLEQLAVAALWILYITALHDHTGRECFYEPFSSESSHATCPLSGKTPANGVAIHGLFNLAAEPVKLGVVVVVGAVPLAKSLVLVRTVAVRIVLISTLLDIASKGGI